MHVGITPTIFMGIEWNFRRLGQLPHRSKQIRSTDMNMVANHLQRKKILKYGNASTKCGNHMGINGKYRYEWSRCLKMGDESPLDGHVIMVINVDEPWCSCCFKSKGPISKHSFSYINWFRWGGCVSVLFQMVWILSALSRPTRSLTDPHETWQTRSRRRSLQHPLPRVQQPSIMAQKCKHSSLFSNFALRWCIQKLYSWLSVPMKPIPYGLLSQSASS